MCRYVSEMKSRSDPVQISQSIKSNIKHQYRIPDKQRHYLLFAILFVIIIISRVLPNRILSCLRSLSPILYLDLASRKQKKGNQGNVTHHKLLRVPCMTVQCDMRSCDADNGRVPTPICSPEFRGLSMDTIELTTGEARIVF